MRRNDRDAVTDAGQGDERVGCCALERDSGTKVSVPARRIEPLPSEEVWAQQQQSLARHVGDVDGCAAPEVALGAHDGESAYWEKQAASEPLVPGERHGKGQFSPFHARPQSMWAVLDEAHFDTGMPTLMANQEGRQQSFQGERRNADTDDPLVAASERSGALAKRGSVGEDLAATNEKVFTFPRQDQPSARAIEQRHAELDLEISNLPGERRLTDIEAACGTRDAAGVGNSDEVAKVPQFHGDYLLQS